MPVFISQSLFLHSSLCYFCLCPGDAKLKISSNICSHLLRAQNIQNTHVQEFCLNGSSSRLKFDTEISIDWLGTQVSLPLDWACAAVEFSGGWGHERGKPMLWYKSILVKRCHLERSQRVFCMYTSLSGFSGSCTCCYYSFIFVYLLI